MKMTIIVTICFLTIITALIGECFTYQYISSNAKPKSATFYHVKSITRIAEGTSPDFSSDGKLIAFNRKLKNCYEILLMKADGSQQRCITDKNIPSEIIGKHKGKATFHPKGKFLLISSENEHGDHGLKTIPGIGDNHDFWVINLETGRFSRLTSLPKDTAIQYPRFSKDGSKLIWSQRYEKEKRAIFKKGREFGYWKIIIADFRITQDNPRIENLQPIEPKGNGYYEPHGFSPDGKKIIFSGAVDPKKTQTILDIYTYDLASHTLTNLTRSDNIHDEMAIFSPTGDKIALMSGTFIGWFPEFGYSTDLYLMNPDGSCRIKLTHFNDKSNPTYLGKNSQITKIAWNEDGSKIVFGVYVHKVEKFYIYMLDFKKDDEKFLPYKN